MIITRIVIPEFIELIDDDNDGDDKENKNITINDILPPYSVERGSSSDAPIAIRDDGDDDGFESTGR